MVVVLDTRLLQDDSPLVFWAHQRIKVLVIQFRKLGKGTTADVDIITLLIPVAPTMEHPASFAGVNYATTTKSGNLSWDKCFIVLGFKALLWKKQVS